MFKLLLFFGLFVANHYVSSNDFVITSFGVGLDSTKLSTSAIQKVIDSASRNGGGTIVIPQGVFLTGALFFKPNTCLRLMKGAVIKGSDNINHYPLIPSRMEGKKLNYYAALINAYNVDSFKISGPGTINGNGQRFWKSFWAYRDSMKKLKMTGTNLDVHRPRLLFIWGCNNVKIENVKLCNSGFWTTHLYQCSNVLISDCEIRSPFKPIPAPSTDGIDIDVCRNVTIRNCYISVNDDAVCIKGGKGPKAHLLPENGVVENILVENCTFGPSHATLTLGSESIHARNIILRNCKVDNNCPILKLKMRGDTFQTFESVTVENITGKCGSVINMAPWMQFFDMEGSTEIPRGTIRNITLSNIKVKCSKFGEMQGNPTDSVFNFVFKDIVVEADKPDFKNKYRNIKAENVKINGAPLLIH